MRSHESFCPDQHLLDLGESLPIWLQLTVEPEPPGGRILKLPDLGGRKADWTCLWFKLLQYRPFCHPEPQAKGLLIVGEHEILRRRRRLRMTSGGHPATDSGINGAV